MSRRPSAPQTDAGERLSKRVMQLKACSRKDAEQYIEGGWVRVKGQLVETPAHRVLPQEPVTVDADASLLALHAVTLVVHKPAGWTDGVGDAAPTTARPGKPAHPDANALLTQAHHWPQDGSGVRLLQRHLRQPQAEIPLETGASGLLVFTQDWRTRRKLHDDLLTMEHELMAEVQGAVPPEALAAMERCLNDPRQRMPHTRFSINSTTPDITRLRFAVKGAHPGLVDYLCERAGLKLLALHRMRLGRVALGPLPPGQWRYLAAHEKF